MMNVLGLSCLLLSLATAGVWSPEPNKQNDEKKGVELDDEPKVLVREGHRVFVIEYQREGVLDAAKKGTHDTFQSAAELAKFTGEGIRSGASQACEKAEVAGDQAVHVIKSGADKTKESVHVIKSGADKTKEAVMSTADKASHAVKDKASSLLHRNEKEISRDETVKEKVSETVDSIKDTAAGAKDEAASYLPKFGQQQFHHGQPRIENGENETLKSVGDYLSDAGTEKTERMKENVKDFYDSATEKSRNSVVDKVSVAGLKVEGGVESAKEKVSGGGQKVAESVKESYDSIKGKVSEAGEKIKESAEKTYDSAKDFAFRAKDTLGFDRVDNEEGNLELGSDIRIQRALRHAGEAAIEKFRQAMEEAYRISSDGEELRKAGIKAERIIIPVVYEDLKDAEANVEAAAIRATDLVKDAKSNLTAGSSKGSRLMASRIENLTSPENLMAGTRMIYLFAFSTVYGSSIWVNFLAGHIMANAIPRQQFGLIQSKMYPVYFKTMAYGLATSFLAHSVLHPWKMEAKIQRWQDYNLLFSLALTLLNMLLLEPRVTKVMFEKLKIEKEEWRGADVADIRDDIKLKMMKVNRKLKLLHRISSTVNMLTLMSLTWHLAYLSSFIKS